MPFFSTCTSLFLDSKGLNLELSKLFNEMWDAYVHRLRPGKNYTIDVQVSNCQVRIKGSVVLQEKAPAKVPFA